MPASDASAIVTFDPPGWRAAWRVGDVPLEARFRLLAAARNHVRQLTALELGLDEDDERTLVVELELDLADAEVAAAVVKARTLRQAASLLERAAVDVADLEAAPALASLGLPMPDIAWLLLGELESLSSALEQPRLPLHAEDWHEVRSILDELADTGPEHVAI